MTGSSGLPLVAFNRQDDGDDLAFYEPPRLVTHIDDAAIAALTRFYSKNIASGSVVLDLMSSWVSHLPEDLPTREVIGHGMNATELAANPRLDRWFIQDLNRNTLLPLEDASVDAVLCCVGVQYLTQPLAVFADVWRVLRPGGLVAVSYSNRCFPMKAVRIWLALDGTGHSGLVTRYLDGGGFNSIRARKLIDDPASDPLIVVTGQKLP